MKNALDSATPEDEAFGDGNVQGGGWAAKITVVLLPVIALAGYTALGGTVVIRGNSMAPELVEGSRCFMHPFGEPIAGDLVLAHGPDPLGLVVKRVVGLEGDQPRLVEGWLDGTRDGKVHEKIGDQRWRPDRSGGGYDRSWPSHLISQRHGDGSPSRLPGMVREAKGFRVAPGHLFLLSDRRDESVDSREWGAVSTEAVVRVIWFCLDSGA